MKLLFTSILASLILFSCNKEEVESIEKPRHKISEGLSSFVFDENSYWIYINSETTNEDSISVSIISSGISQLGPLGPGQGPTGTLDFYEIDYVSSNSGNYTEYIYSSLIAKRLFVGGVTFIDGGTGTEILNASVDSILDSLIIREETYLDVVKIKANADQELSNNMNLYYAPEVGIIKKEILNQTDTSVWELDRFEVSLLF